MIYDQLWSHLMLDNDDNDDNMHIRAHFCPNVGYNYGLAKCSVF